MGMDMQRNAEPPEGATDHEHRICAEKQKGWRSVRLLLLLLVGGLFLGGCGGGGGNQVLSTVSGLVSTFNGYAAGGRVELQTLEGEPIQGGSGEVLSTGLFEITPPDPLPESFLVVVTEATEASGNEELDSAEVPQALQALVENSGGNILTRVTPLSSLVAQYALNTGKTLEESNAAMAAFLDLDSGISPSSLEPYPEDTSEFSFSGFGTFWMDSELSFNLFLDGLVGDSLSGETMDFAEEQEDQFFSAIFMWVLEQVAAAAVGEGVGAISSLITGDGEWDAVQKQMAKISQSLDKIYHELQNFEVEIGNMIRQMSMEADYNVIIQPISQILYNYDLLQSVAKYKNREDAKDKVNVLKQNFDTQVGPGLITINEKLAAPNVGTSFYQKLAEYLLGLVTSGKMTADQALLQYRKTFIYLTGVQIKGLILASENAHLLKNPEDIKRETLKHHSEYIKRITAQAKCFLDGAEKLVVFGFPYAGCTLNYRTITEDNDSPYQTIDSIAADALGVGRQIVTRLVWDPQVPTQYPWADNAPLDYADYFPFMKERMAKLAKGDTFSLYLVREGTQKKAVVENGTVHSMEYRIPGEKEMHAVVLRHTFIFPPSNYFSSVPWNLVVDSNAAKIFDLSEEEANRFPGTVGRKLLNCSESHYHEIEFSPYAGNTRPTCVSASFLAWLPDQFLLWNGTPVAEKLHANSSENRFNPNYKHSIASRSFGFLKINANRVGDGYQYAPGFRADKNSAATQALIRYEPSTSDTDLRYGDVVILNGYFEDHSSHTPQRGMLSMANHGDSFIYQITRKDPGGEELLVIEAIPLVTGTFMNPKKFPVYPRVGFPILLKLRSTGNFLQEDSGKTIRCYENKKVNGVFWSFYPKW